jgi:hypothetical protein
LVHLYALAILKMSRYMAIIDWLHRTIVCIIQIMVTITWDTIQRYSILEMFNMGFCQEDQTSVPIHHDTLHRLYTVWVRS